MIAPDLLPLVRDLCRFATGVVALANEAFFHRLQQLLPFTLHSYPSGANYNGWVVPECWHVIRATVTREDGILSDGSPEGHFLYDGSRHPLGVAIYSHSFSGELDFEKLQQHIITNPELPTAHVYHCMWQYRPWDADWALCVPYEVCKNWGPGRYTVDLVTRYQPGEMLVAEYTHRGRSDRTIVFNAHTCHPCMANDDFAGAAVLIRLMQWLKGQDTYYSYRLILGPEHLGTVFYLRDLPAAERDRLVCGAFAEMPGTSGPIKLASTFLGNQPIDRAFHNAARHHSKAFVTVPWREGAGNDETVWEAPGYEVPFVEVSRCQNIVAPFREYHTSLDTPDLMDEEQLDEFFHVFQQTVHILENNARLYRQFDGLICLSNPQYNLYLERPDPSVVKDLAADSEKWGHLLDSLFRYFDGSMTILDIAEKHDLPFDRLHHYLTRFRDKGLVRFEFAPIERLPITKVFSGIPEERAA